MNYLEAEDLTTGYGRQVISEALNCSFEAGTITSIGSSEYIVELAF